MGAAQARVATSMVDNLPETKVRTDVAAAVRLPNASSPTKLRVLLAERRASAHSELSRRLDRAGHEVLARVTSGQGALDYAALLQPDVVLVAPVLEDGPGVMAALALTRELPGVAAVVLSTHPAAVDPAARPNWGAVAVVPADAEPEVLDVELRRAVDRACEVAAHRVIEQAHLADVAPAAAPTPEYTTPVESPALGEVVALAGTGDSAISRSAAEHAAPSPSPTSVAVATPEPVRPVELVRPAAAPVAPNAGRSPFSFTDEDLLAIGPFVDAAEPLLSAPAAAPAPPAPVAVPATPVTYDADTDVIAQAAECLLERTGLSRSDAMRLMEQEAADTGQRLVDVAHTVLGRDGSTAAEGDVALTA
jgi:AmiR/NasT family two-component response regulator